MCGHQLSLAGLLHTLSSLRAAVVTPRRSERGDTTSLDNQLRAFLVLQRRVPRTHYLLFDSGTKLCLGMIAAHRWDTQRTDHLSLLRACMMMMVC
jgi:hypothetical protein